jgi:hypothetical protein
LVGVFFYHGIVDTHWIGRFIFSRGFANLHFIDPYRNVIYHHKGKREWMFSKTQKFITKGNYLYSFQNVSDRSDYRVFIDSIHVDTLIKESVIIGNLYTPNTLIDELNYYHLVFFLLFVLILVQWIYFQKLKKKRRYFLTKDMELPEHALVFLNFILNQKNHICTTEDLNKILQCSDKSIENQRQIRSKFISSMNTFIENRYHLPETILRVPSEFDKRFVHYTILPSAIKMIEQLLK